MRELTVDIWGLVAVAIGHWLGGLEWASAAFLFFPTCGLMCGVINNEGRRMTKNAIILFLLPVAFTIAAQYVDKLVALVAVKEVSPTIVRIVVEVLLASICWAGITWLAELPTRIIGNWSLPTILHEILGKIVAVLAYSVMAVGFVWCLRLIDHNVVAIPKAVTTIVALLVIGLFAVGVKRLLSAKFKVPIVARSATTSVSSLKLSERPTTKFADVMGMNEVKEQIRLRLVEPVLHAGRAQKYGLKIGGGMLLYGPPGTGKTLLARAVAGELSLPFYVITAADVFGKYVGESERNIKKIFTDIRKNELSVVFIDELESLFPNRSQDVHETTRKVISVLLQELDGIDKGKNPILLIGATNVPWMVDEAFLRPGRFDVKVFVGLPDVEARHQMFINHLYSCQIPHESGLTRFLAERTEGFTGADINGIWERLKQQGYLMRVETFSYELAEKILVNSRPTVSTEIMNHIRAWEGQS